MAEYQDFATDIKTKLTAITGIGLVHDYERQASDLTKFINLFARDVAAGKKEVLGWEITRKQITENQRGCHFAHHTMVVRGYMGLNDLAASSKAFQTLIDKIRTSFRTAAPADPAAMWEYRDGNDPDNSPVQVPLIDDRMFGNILCHTAEIHIVITERIVP